MIFFDAKTNRIDNNIKDRRIEAKAMKMQPTMAF